MWAALLARRLLAPLAAVVLLTGLPSPAGQRQPGKRVKVTVVTILASERCHWVDPRLKCVAEEVRKHDAALCGFRLLAMACQSLPVDERAVFPLVEGTAAEVVVFCCGDQNNRVTLAVTQPQGGEIRYRTVCGKFLPIVTRYQTSCRVPPPVIARAMAATRMSLGSGLPLAAAHLVEGRARDRLILAIRVQPCKGR
jgi:hypothetical protein